MDRLGLCVTNLADAYKEIIPEAFGCLSSISDRADSTTRMKVNAIALKTIGAALLIMGTASVLSSMVTIGSVGGALHLIGSFGILILGHDNAIIGRNIWKHYLHPKKTRLLERTHSIENLTQKHARLPRNWESIYKKYAGAIGRGVFSTLNPNLVHDKQTRDVVLEFWLGETLLLHRLAKMWIKIGKFA